MKDGQGQIRGGCTEPGCGCAEYLKPSDSGHKCEYCGHYPTNHKLMNNMNFDSQNSSSIQNNKASSNTPNSSNQSSSKPSISNSQNKNIPSSSTPASKPTPQQQKKEVDYFEEVKMAPRESFTPATAVREKTVKKNSILDDLNPVKMIKDKTKKKKA